MGTTYIEPDVAQLDLPRDRYTTDFTVQEDRQLILKDWIYLDAMLIVHGKVFII